LLALLAGAPGPIEAVAPTGAALSVATIMGGDVAIVCVQDDGDGHTEADDAVDHLDGVRVVFVVSQTVTRQPDFEVYAAVHGSFPREGTKKVVVDVRGVTTAHVAHVIEDAVRIALVCRQGIVTRMEWAGMPELRKLLTTACTPAAHRSVLARRRVRAEALLTIDRVVEARLERIKARLWHPDGRLARAMVAGWES
jgi:hypothetical protein